MKRHLHRLVGLVFITALVLGPSALPLHADSATELFAASQHLTAAELMTKAPSRAQRYAIRCVVLHQRLDRQTMAISEGVNCILNPRRQAPWPEGLSGERLQAGDEIELSGFLINSSALIQMSDVVYRIVGRDRPIPAPIELKEEDVTPNPKKADLVRLTAPLNYITTQKEGAFHTMRVHLGENGFIVAIIESTEELKREPIPDGSLIEVTGFITRQDGFRPYIWLRTPEDLRVVGPNPAKLRQQRTQGIVIGLISVAAIALWITLLRRQVRRQTAELLTANQRLKASADELMMNLAREKEVSDLKSNFVSMVSHEFRTPLAVILSSTELLRNHLDRLPAETRQTQMDNIVQNTRLMSGMIEEVLLLGKVEGGRLVCTPAPFDLAGFAAMLVDEGLSATKHRCPIHLHVDPNASGDAHGDTALLRHIFSNLLSNAVKYSPEQSAVEFHIHRKGDNAIFTVRDHGIGIPEKDREHLFEAFHRASNVGQRTGTGLGLVIVKRCIDLHGGSIAVDSIEHGGTTVTVTLPLYRSDS